MLNSRDIPSKERYLYSKIMISEARIWKLTQRSGEVIPRNGLQGGVEMEIFFSFLEHYKRGHDKCPTTSSA